MIQVYAATVCGKPSVPAARATTCSSSSRVIPMASPFRTLAWTVAFFNFSWGRGYALGPLLMGIFRELSVGWNRMVVY